MLLNNHKSFYLYGNSLSLLEKERIQKLIELQAEFDKEHRLASEKAQKEEEANIALIEMCYDIQAKTKLVVESLKEAEAEVAEAELKQLVKFIPDEEGVAIDVIPLAVKPPSIVDWKIHKDGKKTYYQIIRVDENSKMYLVFSHMLEDFDREDVETLWKLVKANHGSTRPEEGYERVLWGNNV
uniref:Uncharacterized protein n=1 Tax=Tanacetum cinerariifolium TaxID=118510 RepID=A0A6L2J272_TANCI|nr:hypothetical protein [Tanacetum cinerariifolium]